MWRLSAWLRQMAAGEAQRVVCRGGEAIPLVFADAEREQHRGKPPLREQEPPRIITLTPYVWRAPTTIPMRQWLYGKHYIRKFLSATLAAGGLGKSSLDLVEAIAMAAMLNLLGVPVPDRLRVAKIRRTK